MKVELHNLITKVVDAKPEEDILLQQILQYTEKKDMFRYSKELGKTELVNASPVRYLYNLQNYTFAGGLTSYVRRHAIKAGFKFEWDDKRVKPCERVEADLSFIDRPVLLEAIDACVTRTRGIVSMPTGCLTGDTHIIVNRGGAAQPYRLDGVVERLKAGKASSWDLSITTYTQSRDSEGYVRKNRIVAVHDNGPKQVYELVTASGKSIRATAEHRFLLPNGRWRRLKNLKPGDEVMVTTWSRSFSKNKPKPRKTFYRQVARMTNHPYVSVCFQQRRGFRERLDRVPYHRLIAEAHLNRMSVYELIGRIILNEIEGLKFLDRTWHVHHKDGDILNNELKNLEVLTAEEHHRRHGVEGGWKRVTGRTEPDRIVSIEDAGVENVYDLTMEEPMSNYVANEFVVHNSGKSSLVLGLARVVPCTWVLLTPSNDTFETLVSRWQRLIPDEAVGKIGDGKIDVQRVTVASFQTLERRLKNNDEVVRQAVRTAKAIAIDEVHTVAAPGRLRVAMSFQQAYYRIGLSATPLSRPDGRDMITIGATGDVVFQKTIDDVADVLARGRINMVTCEQHSDKKTYLGSYHELVVNGRARNNLIMAIALKMPKPGLVLVRETKHGENLQSLMLGAGLRSRFLTGDANADERTAAIEALERGEFDIIVATIFHTGRDIPSLRSVVNAGAGDSTTATIQKAGRGSRKTSDKDEFEVWDIFDTDDNYVNPNTGKRSVSWLERHATKRKKDYANEGYEVVVLRELW